MRLYADPVVPIPLEVGDRVTLTEGGSHRWTVRAVTEHFAALTRPAPFGSDDTQYTVIDWRSGVRGPCNLIGQGYGMGVYDEAECAEMLADFEYVTEEDPAYIAAKAAGETSWIPTRDGLEVSHRNRVPLDVTAVNGEPVQLRRAAS